MAASRETLAYRRFIETCLHEYNNQMDILLSVADSKSELREGHNKTKKTILPFYKNKWIRMFGTLKPPSSLRDLLEKNLEDRFEVYQEKITAKLAKVATPIQVQDNNIPALGIDLGTTMCCVMIYRNERLEVIPNRAQANSRTTPSYIGLHENGSHTFGSVAKDQSHRFPESTIFDAKRIIGRHWNDVDLQNDIKHWPFDVVNENGQVKLKCLEKTRHPQEISGMLLNYLRSMAEAYLKLPNGAITKAVVTVPAYFTEPQRRATRDAAESAGLTVLNVLSEPTAAALAYNWNQRESESKHVLVYDLGGGTFDVAIARVDAKGVAVLGVDGDTHLGGQDLDQLLMEYCIGEFFKEEGVNLQDDMKTEDKGCRDKAKRAMSRLKHQCERIKEQLSSASMAEVDIPTFYKNRDLVVPVTKAKFEELARPLIQKTIDIVERAIKTAKEKGVQGKENIKEVILIGGTTRTPLVIKMLEDYFGFTAFQQINPDEAVACGAAIQAAMLTGKLQGNCNEFEVKDVTPLSLGIECADDTTCVLIPRNSMLPFEFEKVFGTDVDYQTSLRITCVQGENKKASMNKALGEFYIYGIAPRPAGQEKIIVTMTIDSMGILKVKAKSPTGSISKGIKIMAKRLE